MKHYFESVETVLEHMGSSKTALTEGSFFAARKIWPQQAGRRQEKDRLWQILDQLKDPMIIVLIVAAIISGFAGEPADSIIILMVVLITQYWRSAGRKGRKSHRSFAENVISLLKSQEKRPGNANQVRRIVPGDIVLLEAGDAVPADMRIIEASSLKIEEASLTGNQYPSKKMPGQYLHRIKTFLSVTAATWLTWVQCCIRPR